MIRPMVWEKHYDEFQELEKPYERLAEWIAFPQAAFDAKVRLSGPTVLDKRLSYCIYVDAKTTTPYFIHNLYELLAFMAHPRHRLSQIQVLTHQHPYPKGFKMIPLPWEEVKIAEFRTMRWERPLARPLAITVDGKNYHTGIEGRAWW